MSTIAIGDLHGNLEALDDLLEELTPEIKSEDTIVFLGDYIDRGPTPVEVEWKNSGVTISSGGTTDSRSATGERNW